MIKSKTLVISGMHRSGTSLVTQWLNRCGLFIGDHLAGPEIGNTEGLFEDTSFQQMHKQFLRKRNCSPVGFEFEALPPLDECEKQQMLALIDDRRRNHIEWAWKDPITCLFLDEYRELIPCAFYLIVIRDYKSTVSSLVTREHKVDMARFGAKKWISKIKWRLLKRKKLFKPFELYAEMFLKVWIHYYEELFRHISLLPVNQYLVIDYTQLIEEDAVVFDHLKNSWQFSLNYLPFLSIYKEKMISPVESFENYITDKNLLTTAKKIEMQLRSLSFNEVKSA